MITQIHLPLNAFQNHHICTTVWTCNPGPRNSHASRACATCIQTPYHSRWPQIKRPGRRCRLTDIDISTQRQRLIYVDENHDMNDSWRVWNCLIAGPDTKNNSKIPHIMFSGSLSMAAPIAIVFNLKDRLQNGCIPPFWHLGMLGIAIRSPIMVYLTTNLDCLLALWKTTYTPKSNRAPEDRPSQEESSLSTTDFQVLC